MTLYTKNDFGLPAPVSTEDYKPTTGEAVGGSWDTAMSMNPLQSMKNLLLGQPDFSEMSEEEVIDYAREERAQPTARMDIEAQKKLIADSGLEGELAPHDSYTADMLDTIIDAKKKEIANAYIYEKSTTGQAFLGLGAGLAASMVDPINMASVFVPVPGLGSVKMMSALGKAESLLGRTAIRAGEGAAAGTLGAMLVEPVIYSGQNSIQADYGLANSLMNLGFGAVMGAGMKAGIGAIGDIRRNYHNSHLKPGEMPRAAPWEYVPRSDESEALRLAHEEDIYRAMLSTDAGRTPEDLRKLAADTAEMYDIWQRRVAYDRQIPISEVYERWKIDYETGEIYDAALREAINTVNDADALRTEIAQVEMNRQQFPTQPDYYDLGGARTRLGELEQKLPQALELIESEKSRSGGFSLNQMPQPSRPGVIAGKKTNIIGANVKDGAQYEVWELEDIIPSHDPHEGFRRRNDYPRDAQERPYHSDSGEQEKVLANARIYEPDLVINTNPNASNGPPIITKDGIVLGGNSRAMTLDMVYQNNEKGANAYRQLLEQQADQFGLDAAQIAGMKRPVLVRVLDDNLNEGMLARKSREYNQSESQQLQANAEGISRSRFLTHETVSNIARGVDEFGSLNKFFTVAESRDTVIRLLNDGVILETEHSSLINKNGLLNDRGKNLIQTILRGIVVEDYDAIAPLPVTMLNKIDMAVPAVARIRAQGPAWDLGPAITDALRLINEATANKLHLETWLAQGTMIPHIREDPVLQTLAITLKNANAREVRARLEIFATEAEKASTGQSSLMGVPDVTPDAAFRKAFFKPLASVDGMHFSDFRPQGNVVHAALDWAVKNGARKKPMEQVLEKLNKALNSKKTTPEEKAILKGHMSELARFVGKVELFDPKLGSLIERAEGATFNIPKSTRLTPPPGAPSEKAAGVLSSENTPSPGKKRKILKAPVKGRAREKAAGKSQEQKQVQKNPHPDDALANVTFMENGRSIIRFFKSANFTSAPHEIYHVIQRQMEEIATSVDASPQMRQMWQAACDFVGAKQGEKWTVAQHEKFARAAERYLWDGRTPNASIQPLLERMKDRFQKIYADVDAAGLQISDEMRSVFDGMLTVPIAEGEARFNAELRRLSDYGNPEQFYDLQRQLNQIDTRYAADLGTDLDAALKIVDRDQADVNSIMQALEMSGSELDRESLALAREELQQADRLLETARKKGRWMDELLACRMARGN